MTIATTEEQRALREAVTAFAQRHATSEQTRGDLDALGAGTRPNWWQALVEQGLHALHLPEQFGGADATLTELAIVVEVFGQHLLPGPHLPTVVASAALTGALDQDAAASLITALASGDTAALHLGDGITATRVGGNWVLDGTTAAVIGLPGTDHVVVAATVDDGSPTTSDRERRWFHLSGDVANGSDLDGAPTDLTRAAGSLRLEALVVSDGGDLGPLPTPWCELVIATLLAAEASGISRWCLDTAVDYARTRVQFDRPIGSFQAVQHICATMLVRAESASAIAWDTARAADQDPDQQRLASAQALVGAIPTAVDNAMDCVSVLGGIGFTWEHDVHLYWRRAVSLAATVGTPDSRARQLGSLARTIRRDRSLMAPDALPDVRQEVREVLGEVMDLPDEHRVTVFRTPTPGGARMVRLAQAGLVAPHYPEPFGRGAGPREQAVITQEFAAHGLGNPDIVIGAWVLPTILAHGNEAQHTRFVAPTLRGELVWCQLFSEPEAGSDLASLKSQARRVEGGWRLTGQKVWTSLAHEADWGACLARTDSDVPKHKGLSYFLVDMRSEGVDIRPLRQATGHSEFNEVFLDDVFVPDDCVVGDPGEGWKLAVTTLANERLNMGADFTHGATDAVREVVEQRAAAGTSDEALQVLGRCASRELTVSAMGLRNAAEQLAGGDPGTMASVGKLANTLAQADNSRDLLGLVGPAALRSDLDDPKDPVMDYLGLPAILFGGGTPEIQMNVIASRVLKLPRGG